MGVQNVRILIPWNGIELANDFFYWNKVDALVNATYERDMGILGVLNSTPAWATEPGQPAPASPPADPAEYLEFVGAVAQRYAGKVSAYEIWNLVPRSGSGRVHRTAPGGLSRDQGGRP